MSKDKYVPSGPYYTESLALKGGTNTNENILILLEQQNDNFPVITTFIKEKRLNPTVLFLPQTLKGLSEEITHRSDLMIECFSYLDLVKIYSLVTYNDPEHFTDNVLNIIASNRVVEDSRLIVNKEATDDFLFSSKEDMVRFIQSNKFLLSLYIFSLIDKAFYKHA